MGEKLMEEHISYAEEVLVLHAYITSIYKKW